METITHTYQSMFPFRVDLVLEETRFFEPTILKNAI